MYAVAGVTGQTGSAVAEALIAQGKSVTVIVRSEQKGEAWKAKGAKAAVAELGDAGKMRGILCEAEGAYLLIPPNLSSPNFLEDRRRIGDALATAVKESGIGHVVFLSSVGGHLSSGTGPILITHYGETVLAPVAKNLTILRPSSFIENFAPLLDIARTSGKLPTFLTPARKIPMIATKDIGRLAAESLVHPARGKRVIEMAGPEDYSPADIARILSDVLKRQVQVEPLPLEAAVPVLTSLGMSANVAGLLQEMNAGINSGLVAYEDKGTEFRRGTTTPAQVFRELLSR